MALVSRLGTWGVSAAPFGSFAGKSENITTPMNIEASVTYPLAIAGSVTHPLAIAVSRAHPLEIAGSVETTE